jgi:hypothetical protein
VQQLLAAGKYTEQHFIPYEYTLELAARRHTQNLPGTCSLRPSFAGTALADAQTPRQPL